MIKWSAGKARYSDELDRRVNAQIPGLILQAMHRLGWNALGIYELVAEEIKREKRERRGR